MIYKVFFISLLIYILSSSFIYVIPVEAALILKGKASAQEGFNPTVHHDDIILPMPCNLSMVLKIVGVPTKGLLWDMSSRFGYDSPTYTERAYYDSRYTANLSAPFTQADLPNSWQKFASNYNNLYYLIGKYEVTELQWDAIMNNICPAPTTENIKPKTKISWYDATEFTKKYTLWLLKSHPRSLPQFQNDSRNTGYIRLPTEVEWEYAAKGGHTTTMQELLELNFFPIDSNEDYTKYAVFRPENAIHIKESPACIGSRKANKLGLYDTSGNVAEMVIDIFRFSLGGRLHGSAGGFVRKGGSFLSSLEEIYPGRREEIAFFQKNGVVSSKDMGFRIALSGINTPGGNRQDILQSEWKKAGEDTSALLNKTNNPLQELDRLIANTNNHKEKSNYQSLRNIIKENNIILEHQELQTVRSEILNTAFLIQSIQNYSSRITLVKSNIKKLERIREDSIRNKTPIKTINNTITNAKKAIINFQEAIQRTMRFYKTKVEDLHLKKISMVNTALKEIQQELIGQKDSFSKDFLKEIMVFEKHLNILHKNKHNMLNLETIEKDVLRRKDN